MTLRWSWANGVILWSVVPERSADTARVPTERLGQKRRRRYALPAHSINAFGYNRDGRFNGSFVRKATSSPTFVNCALPAYSIFALVAFRAKVCASMTGVVEIFVGTVAGRSGPGAARPQTSSSPTPSCSSSEGLLVSFIPGIPRVHLDPELVFLLFLPPLLFPAALFTSWRDFRTNLRPILLLAIGLVLMTTVSIALLAHHFIGLPLAAGFVLGAIISPPDAIAATAIAQRLRVPRRIVTVLEGESLVNDASALVAYALRCHGGRHRRILAGSRRS